MNIPRFSITWSLEEVVKNLIEAFRQIENDDKQNRKTNADVELAGAQRLILIDTVTGTRYAVSVASGSLTLTAL